MTVVPCRRCGKVECAEEAERSLEVAEMLDAAEPREVGVPLPEPEFTALLQDWAIEAIKPESGQSVVLTLDRMPEPHILEAIGEQLRQAFPDNKIVVMEQGSSLSVEDDPPVAMVTREEAESVLRPHDFSLQDADVRLYRKLTDALEAIDRAEGKQQ